MKILYATNKAPSSKIQLSRFLEAMQNSGHQIKIAAYKASSPKIHIDWTLDAILEPYAAIDRIDFTNKNLQIYYDQVKKYSPDLIISDLETYTTYISQYLKCDIWQVSANLLKDGLTPKYKQKIAMGLNVSGLLADYFNLTKVALFAKSKYNFVYSHFGDALKAPQLNNNHFWVRPYHILGNKNILCQHYMVAGINNDKKIINIIKQYQDTIIFSDQLIEKFTSVNRKDIKMEDEYGCNIRNALMFVCQGQASLLADAFYNGKYSIIYPDYYDAEAVMNSLVAKKMQLGNILTQFDDITDFTNLSVKTHYNKIRYLHELIADFERQ